MKLVRFPKLSTLLLIACSVLVFGGSSLNAQISRGKFTLPVQTHWGTIVMAPGPYSYTLDRTTVGLMLSVRTPRGKLSLIPIPTTRGVSTDETFRPSMLLLETQGGETTVRSIHFGQLGVTLHYRASKVSAHDPGQSSPNKQLPLSVAGG
jgi:hypothetical protein